MKYKPLIVCIGVIGLMTICSSVLSGPSTVNKSSCLNAKRDYPASSPVVVEASVESDSPAIETVTLPNAKREVFPKIVSETANAI